MGLYESGENYLETILFLQKDLPYVRAIDVVNTLDVSKPSVSVAMKKLRENDYITIDGDGHINLTKKGHDIASIMGERHVLLRDWFTLLGVDSKIAEEDACRIEHYLSEETFTALKSHISDYKKR